MQIEQSNHNEDTIHSMNGIQFGFVNEKGTQILIDSALLPLNPELLVYSIDTSGQAIDIKFEKYQKATGKDKHRQIYFNFNDAGGYLFSIKNKTVDYSKTSVLCTQNFLNDHPLIKMSNPNSKTLPESIRQKLESDKKRKIKTYKEMKVLEGERSIYLIEFSKKKDSALVSLVLTGTNNMVYFDFPALYDEQSTWRVDDGGEFGFEYFYILAAFKVDGKIEIITDWIGPEGFSTLYLQEDRSSFKKIKEYYRYTAPI